MIFQTGLFRWPKVDCGVSKTFLIYVPSDRKKAIVITFCTQLPQDKWSASVIRYVDVNIFGDVIRSFYYSNLSQIE